MGKYRLIIAAAFVVCFVGLSLHGNYNVFASGEAEIRRDSGLSRGANLSDIFDLENMPSDRDLRQAYAAACHDYYIGGAEAETFIDSLLARISTETISDSEIDSAYIETIGADIWKALRPDNDYPSGFTVNYIEEIRYLTTVEEEEGAEGTEEEDVIAPILFALIIIILAAKLGGDLVERFKQPAVLGELIFGMILGNLALLGIQTLEPLKHHITIEILAEIGVILLLFEVGLESSVKEMLSVGLTSLVVALIGVIVPFFLGWWVAALFYPNESIFIHVFVGATLTATSVGITARVLKDIGKIRTREAKIILGAAVFDDIMGLVVLAVVVGIIDAHNTGGSLSSTSVLWIVGKAVLFIVGAVSVGSYLAPHFFKLASRLRAQSILITFSLMFCFIFSLLADKIGLAPIVGAFAAGMILSGVNFKDIFTREEKKLEELLSPISAFLVPIFFVYMGMNVDLSTFANVNVIAFAAVLTLVAILSKQVCSLAGLFEKKINAWVVGVGMIPRGEVGLIFAGIGAKMMVDGERVISPDAYSAVIIMVMVTTLVTPPVLKLIFTDRHH